MSRQQGVSLLEIMISVLVLSIGILGMATLQLQSRKSSQSALTRTEVTQYAYMITDMMRANRSAALLGQYNIGMGEVVASGSSMAIQDLQYWKQALLLCRAAMVPLQSARGMPPSPFSGMPADCRPSRCCAA